MIHKTKRGTYEGWCSRCSKTEKCNATRYDEARDELLKKGWKRKAPLKGTTTNFLYFCPACPDEYPLSMRVSHKSKAA